MQRTVTGSVSQDGGGSTFLEGTSGGRIGLTFRRLENLRLFVAAVKLRYLVSSADMNACKSIARKGEGWQQALATLAFDWLEAISAEVEKKELGSERN